MFNVNSSQLLPPLPTRTDVVTCIVKVDGQQIPDTVMVLSVRVTKAANRVPFALLHIADGNPAQQHFEVSDTDLFSPGKQIEILAGYHGQNATIFKGIVVRHAMRIPPQGHPALEIECKHLCVKLSAGRSSKFYFNQKDSDIISALLNGKGIQNSVDSSPLQHREMVQAHISDWDFLVARAEANGMLVLANDDAVAVQKPNFSQAAKFPVNWGSSLFEFEAEMDARDQYPTVKASVWSAADQALTVKQPGGGGGVGGFSPPAAVPRNVPTSVSSALSAVPGGAVSTDYTQVMGLSSFDVQHSGHLNLQEAQAWAEAQMTKSQLAKARGRVKFEGVANVAPGDCIELQGVGVRHSGKVYLTGVSHEIERGIWMTDAQFGLPQEWFMSRFPDAQALPAGGLLASVHGLQVGVVTDLANDPLGEDRIQVRLPLVEAQGNGIWMRISCQDAGQQRGAYWRPEVGDEVICGFINDDPRQGIVLGMMNSSAKPAPLPSSSNDNHKKGWTTRSGMKMIFDDDQVSLSIDTPKGKKLTIDEKADSIQMQDEHGNKITLDKSGIVIESGKDLTLKAANNLQVEGVNIAQKAQASFKAEAQGQVQVSAASDMVIKGAFVRIN